jgi:hypothetical protein
MEFPYASSAAAPNVPISSVFLHANRYLLGSKPF